MDVQGTFFAHFNQMTYRIVSLSLSQTLSNLNSFWKREIDSKWLAVT